MIAFGFLWVLTFLMLPIFRDFRREKATLVLPFAMGAALLLLALMGLILVELPGERVWRTFLIVICASGLIYAITRRSIVSEVKEELKLEREALKFNGIHVSGSRKGDSNERVFSVFRVIMIIYFSSTFITALGIGVINGDAQVYNVSRVYSWLLSGTIFLESHGSGYHAYMSVGHDLLYVVDSSLGSTYGLGLICWSESVALFLLIVSTFYKEEKTSHRNNISTGNWAGLLYMSVPLFYFQSSSVKNDLAVTLFGALFCLSAYRVYVERRDSRARGSIELLVSTITFGLATYFVKSYGALIGLAVIVSMAIFAIQDARQKVSTYERYMRLRPHRLALFTRSSILIGMGTLILVFWSHVKRYWAAEESLTVKSYTTGIVRWSGIDMQDMTNPLRIVYEMVLQLPLPVRVEGLPGMHFLGDYSGPYTYHFGGYFGEDIAWCGSGFMIICVYGAVQYFRINRGLRTVNGFFCVVSLLYMLILSLSILWQPWYSRFLGMFYVGIIGVSAEGIASLRLNGRSLCGWLAMSSYTTIMAATKCLAIVTNLQIINRDYYSLKSHGLTQEQIRAKVVKNLATTVESRDLSICIEGGPTLYILKELYAKQRGSEMNILFPSRDRCQVLERKGTTFPEEFKNVQFYEEG